MKTSTLNLESKTVVMGSMQENFQLNIRTPFYWGEPLKWSGALRATYLRETPMNCNLDDPSISFHPPHHQTLVVIPTKANSPLQYPHNDVPPAISHHQQWWRQMRLLSFRLCYKALKENRAFSKIHLLFRTRVGIGLFKDIVELMKCFWVKF